MTQDLNLDSGGWLEAELFIAPIGFDVSNPKCKSSYSGVIEVDYSIDRGSNWRNLDRCVTCVSCVCPVCVLCVSCVLCPVCVLCVSCVCAVCVLCVSCVLCPVCCVLCAVSYVTCPTLFDLANPHSPHPFKIQRMGISPSYFLSSTLFDSHWVPWSHSQHSLPLPTAGFRRCQRRLGAGQCAGAAAAAKELVCYVSGC